LYEYYENFHGAFRADQSDVHNWLNKDEEDFGYQNLNEEETAQQAEEDDSGEEEEEETYAKFKFSEVKQNLDSSINFVDSDPQYNKYYLMLMDVKQDVVKELYKKEHKPK
jgi:hypothetical protein